MRAGFRFAMGMLAAVLALGPAPLTAQNETGAATNTPAAAVGPRELENFSLQGTVTRPAEPAPQERAVAPPPRATAPPDAAVTSTQPRTPPPAPAQPSAIAERPLPAPARTAEAPASRPSAASLAAEQRASVSSITVDLPPPRVAAAAPAAGFSADDTAAAALAPERDLPVWPWLLAAMALGAGAAFMFFRRNSREALAGGPQLSAFVAPEAAPRPMPAPPRPAAPPPVAAPPAVPAQPSGIVATRIRPWLDAEFEPDRCIVDKDQIVFEFELDLFNSGSAPARDVRVAIEMFNASPTQEQELAQFFASPPGSVSPVPDIASFKRFQLRPQIIVANDRLRVLEAGGRRVFVPLIAINVLYGWGKGEGQTAAAFLLGREGASEKLAPFRLDLGNRIYRKLGTRILPGNLRR